MVFYTEVIARSDYFHSSVRVESIEMLEPTTHDAVQSLLDDDEAKKVGLVIYETYRAQERQTLLHEQNPNQPELVGALGYGVAALLGYTGGDGNADQIGDFSMVGALASAHGLLWGPDIGEAQNYVSTVPPDKVPDLQAGIWYPEAPAREAPPREATEARPAPAPSGGSGTPQRQGSPPTPPAIGAVVPSVPHATPPPQRF